MSDPDFATPARFVRVEEGAQACLRDATARYAAIASQPLPPIDSPGYRHCVAIREHAKLRAAVLEALAEQEVPWRSK